MVTATTWSPTGGAPELPSWPSTTRLCWSSWQASSPGWQKSAVASGNITVGGDTVAGVEAAAVVEAEGLKKQPSQGGRLGKEKAMKMT